MLFLHREDERTTTSGEDGVITIHFAVILPLMVALVFAIIDFSWILRHEIAITISAQRGAQAAGMIRSGFFAGNCVDATNQAYQSTVESLETFWVVDANNIGDIQVLFRTPSDIGMPVTQNFLRHKVKFVEVTVTKNLNCFLCQLMRRSWPVGATSRVLLENSWGCSTDPYDRFEQGPNYGVLYPDLRI